MFDSLMAFLAEYFYLIVVVLALLFLAVSLYSQVRGAGGSRWSRAAGPAMAAVFIGALSYLLARLGNYFISSPRPFIETGHPALIAGATDNGFPSDHTLLLGVLAAVVTLVSWRWGLLFWGLALLVGLARVYAGVHHLLDVAGALGIALLALAAFLVGKNIVERSRRNRRSLRANAGE